MLSLGGALRKCCRSGNCPMLQIDVLEHSGILFAESFLAFYLRQAGSEARWVLLPGIIVQPEGRREAVISPGCDDSARDAIPLSLLVLTDCWKTLQQEGCHVVLEIQVLLIYCARACKGSVAAFASRRWKALGISSAGRNGRASSFLTRLCVPRSFRYACCSPNSWTWNKQQYKYDLL